MWSVYTGNDGDSSRTVYLFQNGITTPAAPLSTEGFNTDGEAVNVGTWSTAATAPPAGQTIYVASLNIRQPNSTGDWVIDGTWQVNPASTSGTNGNPGQGVREVTIFRLNDSTINASSGTFADPLASNSEWSFNVPEITVNGQVVYSRTRTFTSDGAAPQDTSWSGQSIAFRRVDGQTVTGPRGQGVRDATIFRLNSTTISSSSGTYTDPLNGNTSWSFSVPAISANGDIIYSSTRTLTSDAASPQDGTWSTPTIAFRRVDGQTVTGPAGTPAPRFSERLLYTNPAVSTASAAPSAPSATITWSTGALSSITSGWSETPPTQQASSAQTTYRSVIVFIDTAATATTTAATGGTVTEGINFSGLVTFDSGAFAVGGSTVTNIDGGNIATDSIRASSLDIDDTITLAGASSGFVAGRTGISDFGTDGFYIGRTSTGGTTADGFQLSHTSVTDNNSVGDASTELTSGTVQGVIHDDRSGLRIYEPLFYSRGTLTPGGDQTLNNAGTISLAGGEVHTITFIGGGGGGGSTGSNGGTGGATNINVAGSNFTAAGGAGGTPISGSPTSIDGTAGNAGEASPYGQGGVAGIGSNTSGSTANAGQSPPANAFGAGGGGAGGAADPNSGDHGTYSPGGNGGRAGTQRTVTVDRTGLGATTLTANTVGAGGAGGTSGAASGGAGRGGVVVTSDVLSGYNVSTLSDFSAYIPIAEQTWNAGYRRSSTSTTFSALVGDAFSTTFSTSTSFGHNLNRTGNANFASTGQVASPGNVTFGGSVSGSSNTAFSASGTIIQWRRGG